MSPLYSIFRKSRHRHLLIFVVLLVITIILFLTYSTILNFSSKSALSRNQKHLWGELSLRDQRLLLPLLPDSNHYQSDDKLQVLHHIMKEEEERQEKRRSQQEKDIGEMQNIMNTMKSSHHKQSERGDVLRDDAFASIPVMASVDKDDAGVPLRVIHLDLKGAPPKLGYVRTLLPLIVAAGANAVLIEYEDMFPFQGALTNLSALNAYSREQVQQMLSWFRQFGLHVIPLIQTFGHLEYALKLPEFRHLRELSSFPQEVCPSNPVSFSQLIKELIDQVMAVHYPHVHYVHIGCDEVYHLAACGRCTRRHLDGRVIFTEHVKHVATYVRENYPGVIPLVWDDMFRQWSPMDLQESGLGTLVEPVVWVYIDDITRLVPHYVWYMYGQTFQHVWVASAFKGAYGETAVAPNIARHLRNHASWLRLMRSIGGRDGKQSSTTSSPPIVRNFRGIILTGWSRYDHFAVLCELLPVSLPSLLLNLLFVSRKRDKMTDFEVTDDLFQQWLQLLSCPQRYSKVNLDEEPYQWRLGICSFPGNNLYNAVSTYVILKSRVDSLYTDVTDRQGWTTDYNLRHNFSSPFRVLQALNGAGENGHHLTIEVNYYRNETAKLLSEYYDRYTVDEWLEQKVDPLQKKLQKLEKAVEKLMKINTWPRRPIP